MRQGSPLLKPNWAEEEYKFKDDVPLPHKKAVKKEEEKKPSYRALPLAVKDEPE